MTSTTATTEESVNSNNNEATIVNTTTTTTNDDDKKSSITTTTKSSRELSSTALPAFAVEVNTDGDVHLEKSLSATLVASQQQQEEKSNKDSSTDYGKEDDDVDGDMILPETDLSKKRNIVIVTTAGLPWRTGTAVNPLLRALALSDKMHTVTLMIPWLDNEKSRKLLYGNNTSFTSSDEQKEWIYKYCIERCGYNNIPNENFHIEFWNGIYQESFGSIFPIEDICAKINSTTDVCILEEPEHLNWFRIQNNEKDNNNKKQNKKIIIPSTSTISDSSTLKTENTTTTTTTTTATDTVAETTTAGRKTTSTTKTDDNTAVTTTSSSTSNSNNYNIAWKDKFTHVIGILHTNYADYMKQYSGIGFIASGLNTLSAMTVKAHCHKIIRLSATLPNFDPSKEITCNVHGVRDEFFIKDQKHKQNNNTTKQESKQVNDGKDDNDDEKNASVYFIGKLIWAKGFDYVLRLQSKYKKATGEYFPIDIYGSGKDEDDIIKTFYGRDNIYLRRLSSSEKDKKAAAIFDSKISLRDQLCGSNMKQLATELTTEDKIITTNNNNNNNNVNQQQKEDAVVDVDQQQDEEEKDDDDSMDKSSHSLNNNNPLEILGDLPGRTVATTVDTADAALKVLESVISAGLKAVATGSKKNKNKNDNNNKSNTDNNKNIYSDDSSDSDKDDTNTTSKTDSKKNDNIKNDDVTANTSNETTATAMTTTTPERKKKQTITGTASSIAFHMTPIRTRSKFRKNPIPARFLGVKDHIVIRDIPEHKIFLNMSTSEVLCTTSAEALAMGKFVILPKHPSNEFFLQFPNCLAYETIDQCVLKLQYALDNEPEPLSDTHKYVLSWEGATERLIKAAAITKREANNRIEKGLEDADKKAARFLSDATRRSQKVGNFLFGKILKSATSS